MPELKDALLTPAKRPAVIADCEQLIEEEVQDKSGLTGFAVKGAFAVVKSIKPGVIRETVDALLDDFVARMEPFYAQSNNKDFARFLVDRKSEIADALLGVTDARAQRSKNATMKKAYEKLRPEGKKHVEAAVPRLSRLVDKHLNK